VNLPTVISIWILAAASVAQSIHIGWVFKQHLKLRQRVHHLEMEKEFPGYWEREHEQIEKDRWS
jgi:hypothetical protein